jgi:hypothetical protein
MWLLEAKETKFSVWIKSSLRLSWISYIGRIYKTTSIDKRTKWKQHLVSILSQNSPQDWTRRREELEIIKYVQKIINMRWLPSSMELEVQILMN